MILIIISNDNDNDDDNNNISNKTNNHNGDNDNNNDRRRLAGRRLREPVLQAGRGRVQPQVGRGPILWAASGVSLCLKH